ncbi:hypothetical protein EC957_010937, partial [Mortierella hygrophila]
NKYVCVCGMEYSNRYSLKNHVKPKSTDPCKKMCEKAVEIVTTNTRCNDKSMALNYRPEEADPNLHDKSDVDVDENADAESDIGMDENADAESDVGTDEIADAESVVEDENNVVEPVNIVKDAQVELIIEDDIRDILLENDRVLAVAADAIDKARSDIRRLLENTHKQP